MNTPTAEPPDLINLMEWNRFAEDRKTLLEALTILNNRHRTIVAELNQRLIDRQESFQAQLIRIEDTWREKLRESQAQVFALREALEYALDPEYLQEISSSRMEDDADQSVVHCAHQMFRAALSTPPPPCVPLADVMPLVEAMDKIHHWHDSCYNPETQKDEGMVVSAEAVRELWEARADWHRKHDPAFPAKHTTP